MIIGVGQWATRLHEIWAGWFHPVSVTMYLKRSQAITNVMRPRTGRVEKFTALQRNYTQPCSEIMGRMGICFTSVATSWWGEAYCLLLCFPTGTCIVLHLVPFWILTIWGSVHIEETVVGSRVSNSYDQPQLPPTKMATTENCETKQSRISGKPDRALCPYDTDMSVSYHAMYFSYDHVF